MSKTFLNKILNERFPLFIILCILIIPRFHSGAQTLVINEIMSANQNTITDRFGDYSDWIELSNNTNDTLLLEGVGLSDDVDEPFKWTFPSIRIASGSFLLVFASGRDIMDHPGELHTNFNLNAEGENIILTAPDSTILTQIAPVELRADISYGRFPDGERSWLYFIEPTPGESNGEEPPPQPAPEPQFSIPSGFYRSGTRLTISCPDPDATIRYTLDGSIPVDTSRIYEQPLTLDSTTVLRTVSCHDAMLPSRHMSNTYFIDYTPNLPVISLMTNPANLFDWETGIYVEGPNAAQEIPHHGANYWRNIEIPVYIEFFEQTERFGFALDAGVKIFGGWSRIAPQKSLKLTARDEYGTDRLDYRMFPYLPISDFKSVLLRNSGGDRTSTMFRDGLITGLMEGTGVVHQDYRPIILFINGVYWGIHNLRERIGEHFISDHCGIDLGNIDIIEENGVVKAGDSRAFDLFTNFI